MCFVMKLEKGITYTRDADSETNDKVGFWWGEDVVEYELVDKFRGYLEIRLLCWRWQVGYFRETL